MGVNVEAAYLALHFGPSNCIDDYLQEVGQIGRSSEKQSHAVLLKNNHGLATTTAAK